MNNDRKKQSLHYRDRQAPKPFAEGLPPMPPLFSAFPTDWVVPETASAQAPLQMSLASAHRSSQASATPYLLRWLQSGGNLDFMVLALCSCVLTVLCHQPVLPSGSGSLSTTSAAPSSEIGFAIKAGLSTTFSKLHAESSDDE
ncbi:MAG: hypothetical protein HY785_15265 [Oscillatoriophycideae cyanobacterium NC_groundwater_1537_Pr4_S-0.65um_50_18]|nr:hypothetical protein [Oscillatoriophycideae cyanobacterium NC_groundwater_1537_Pr4_S-0.65um_50_18]